MAQSRNGAEFESDVISLGTGQKLNFGDDTIKGKDSYNCEQFITKICTRDLQLYIQQQK